MGGIQRGLERKRGKEGGRERGMTTRNLKEECSHFLSEEVPSGKTTPLKKKKKKGPCNVFIIVLFPPVWLRWRKNLWSKSIIIASFMIPKMLFYFGLPVELHMKKHRAITSDSRVQIEVTLQFVLIFASCVQRGKTYDAHRQ